MTGEGTSIYQITSDLQNDPGTQVRNARQIKNIRKIPKANRANRFRTTHRRCVSSFKALDLVFIR